MAVALGFLMLTSRLILQALIKTPYIKGFSSMKFLCKKLALQKIPFLTRKTFIFLYRIFAETERRITCQGGYTPEQEYKHSP